MSLEAFIFICISGYLQMYECFFYSLNSGKCIIFVCLVPAGPVVEHIVQLMDEKEQWLISEFLNTQPSQFLYYLISYMVGKPIYRSQTAML